jgi:hypothetical protein
LQLVQFPLLTNCAKQAEQSDFPGEAEMRKIITLIACWLCVLVPSAQAADEYFHRKPGLWEISMEMDSHPGKGRTVKYCLDEKTDAELIKLGESAGQMCTKHEMHREGADYLASSTCNMMGSTIVSNSVFKGDFTSSYEGDINSTYTPPLMGKPTGHMKINGRWLGACEAGQQPGDMIMPNGTKMNIGQLGSMAKGPTPPANGK